MTYSAYFTGTGGILLFMLTLHTICQPYVKRAHNIVDTLLLANLVLINYISFFNFHKSRSHSLDYGATVSAASIQLVLIYLPLIVMGMYFLIVHGKGIFRKCTGCFLPEKSKRLRELMKTISTQKESFDLNVDNEFVHDRSESSIEYQEF